MDRQIDPAFLRRRKRKRIIQIGSVVGIILAFFFLLSAWIAPSIPRNEIRTAMVDSGLVEATISASGTVTPEFEEVIASPAETRVLQVLKRPGEKLHKGEQFLLLDANASKLDLDRAGKDLSLKINQAKQLKLEQEHAIAELESQLHIKTLRLTYLKSKSEQEQKMFEIGGSSKDQLAQTKLEEEIAGTELTGLEQTIANARQSLANQLEGLSTEIATLTREKAESQRQLDILSCRSTNDGVLTYLAQEIGATIHRGDVIARIANLDAYRVEAVVSDIHSGTLAKGLPAHVSWTGGTLDGEISAINPAIENGTVKFYISLADRADPRLRSNLRVDVAVITARKGIALRVAKGPFLTGGSTQDVFVVKDGYGVRTPVTIGVFGFDYVEMVSGVNKGDEIIISDMKEYMHAKEIHLK
jgi:HlyD family secretion protein